MIATADNFVYQDKYNKYMATQRAYKSDNEYFYQQLFQKHSMLEHEYEKNVIDYNDLDQTYTEDREAFEKLNASYISLVEKHEELKKKAANDIDSIKTKFTVYMRHTQYIQSQNDTDLKREQDGFGHLDAGYTGLRKKFRDTTDTYNSAVAANEGLQDEYADLKREYEDLLRRYMILESQEAADEKREEEMEEEEDGEEEFLKEQIEELTEKVEELKAAYEIEVEDHRIKYSHLKQNHERLETKAKKTVLEKKKKIAELKITIKELTQQHKKDLLGATGNCDGISGDLADLQRKHAAHMKEMNDLQGVHASVGDKLKSAKARYKDLQEKYADLNEDYTIKFGDHEEKFLALQRKHNEAKAQFASSYKRFKENYTQLQAEYIATVEEGEKKVGNLQIKYVVLHDTYKAQQAEYEIIKSKYNSELRKKKKANYENLKRKNFDFIAPRNPRKL